MESIFQIQPSPFSKNVFFRRETQKIQKKTCHFSNSRHLGWETPIPTARPGDLTQRPIFFSPGNSKGFLPGESDEFRLWAETKGEGWVANKWYLGKFF